MTLSPYAIILIPCAILLVVLGFVTLNRYIAYKERVALARLGFSLEDLNRDKDAAAKRQGHRGVLWGGVMTAMSGLALLLGLSTLGMGAWLIGGLLPLFVGLGMVFIYFNTSGTAPDPTADDDEPPEDDGAEVSPFVTESERARNNGPDAR